MSNHWHDTARRPARDIVALSARGPVAYFLVHALFQVINVVHHWNAVLSVVRDPSRFLIACPRFRLALRIALPVISIGECSVAYITWLGILPGKAPT